jgi:hypothetical protein
MEDVLAALRRRVNALRMENATNASGSSTKNKTAISNRIWQYQCVLLSLGAITANGLGQNVPADDASRIFPRVQWSYGPRFPSATLGPRMTAHSQWSAGAGFELADQDPMTSRQLDGWSQLTAELRLLDCVIPFCHVRLQLG